MDPEPSCALHAGGSRVTASGEVTVWFTQRRGDRRGREKDNFLRIFFAALRLCVINLRDKYSHDERAAFSTRSQGFDDFAFRNRAVTAGADNPVEFATQSCQITDFALDLGQMSTRDAIYRLA
jgi:hypothetical protein